jgi:peptidyl-prolyl cis-trans isomerase C
MTIKKHLEPLLLACMLLSLVRPVTAYAGTPGASVANDPAAAPQQQVDAAAGPPDMVARVGDQPITMSLLNTMLNSSAVVGLSIPMLGTHERDLVRIQLLDKAISANLLYLDALKKGVDKDPGYRRDLQRFEDAILSLLYRKRYVSGDVEVSEEEIKAFFDSNIEPGTEYTDDVKTAIAAKIRKQRVQGQKATLQVRLREGVEVEIEEQHLQPDADEGRSDAEVVASIDGAPILWGELKEVLTSPVNAGSMANRTQTLNRIINQRILAQKGRAAGLEQDPVYRGRVGEFSKTRLINLHRGNLVRDMQPSEQELEAFFEENRDRITVKETRSVQMVVLETGQEAEEIKQKIDSGEITIYQAAMEYSIDPNAKKTLGEIGWVARGSGFPELDEVTFSLGPGELGGPVQSPAGWHLVKVLDVREAQYQSLDEPGARKLARRMLIHQRLDDYVVKLREKDFPVEVYADKLKAQFAAEREWMAAKLEKAASSSEDEEKLKTQIEKLMGGAGPVGPGSDRVGPR